MEERKIAIPISGIDDSMIGASINGWKIICISANDDLDDTPDFAGIRGADCFGKLFDLLQWDGVYDSLSFIKKEPQFHIIALAKTTDISNYMFKWDYLTTVDAIRLFKTSQVGFWIPIDFTEPKLKMLYDFLGLQSNPFEMENPIFSLAEDENELFTTFVARLCSLRYPSKVTQMIPFFHEACKTKNKAVRFVLRITILEMLIDGNAELSYRLSHHLAVFLGRTLDESKQIASNMKKMYNARSKYLHEGDESKITDEYCRLAYEYARRLIANLTMTADSIQEVRNKLDVAGYGTNPYQVQF